MNKTSSYGFWFLLAVAISVVFMFYGETLTGLKLKNIGHLFGELDASGQYYQFVFNYKNLLKEGEFPIWNFFALYGQSQKFWYFIHGLGSIS